MTEIFYEMLDDPEFLANVTGSFGVFAADYALGFPFTGMDMLARAGGNITRVLISANAEKYLPEDYKENCDFRIDKSGVKISTLANGILDLGRKDDGDI